VRKSRRALVVEFLIYVAFLALFCVMTFSERAGVDGYFFTRSVKTLFSETEFFFEDSKIEKTFQSIATESDFWSWLRGPTVNEVFGNGVYLAAEGGSYSTLFAENRSMLLTGMRLRQFRVPHVDCVFDSRVSSRIPTSRSCSGSYYAPTQSTATFGKRGRFRYSSPSTIDSISLSGRAGQYPQGGFVVDIPLNMTLGEATAFVSQLEDDNFVDTYTRAITLEVIAFSPPLEMYSFVTQLVEFPLGGGALPIRNYRTLSLARYINVYVGWIIAEVIFFGFLVFYTVIEVILITKIKKEYFRAFWSYFDMLNLLLFYVSSGIKIACWAVIRVGTAGEADIQLYQLSDLVNLAQNVNSINMFLCFFKSFKYFRIYPRLTILSNTLYRSASDVATFSAMFCVVLFGFAVAHYLAYGSNIYEFRNWQQSAFTLFRALLGDFDVTELQEQNPLLGPTFFIIFMLLSYLVLLNMFIAIVNEHYEDVRDQVKANKNALVDNSKKYVAITLKRNVFIFFA